MDFELLNMRFMFYFRRQHRTYIDLNLKPFRGNNNINNYIFHTKQKVQFKTSNKYILLLLLFIYIYIEIVGIVKNQLVIIVYINI